MLSNNLEQPELVGTSKRGFLLLIFIFWGIAVNAQNFNSSRCNSSYGDRASILTQQQSYQSYQSVVYEPFSSATPSQITERRNTGYSGDIDLGGWGDPDIAEPGDTSGESPVGEPWVLLFFAAVAAVVIRLKRKNVKSTI